MKTYIAWIISSAIYALGAINSIHFLFMMLFILLTSSNKGQEEQWLGITIATAVIPLISLLGIQISKRRNMKKTLIAFVLIPGVLGTLMLAQTYLEDFLKNILTH